MLKVYKLMATGERFHVTVCQSSQDVWHCQKFDIILNSTLVVVYTDKHE